MFHCYADDKQLYFLTFCNSRQFCALFLFSGPWGRCMGSICGLGGSQSRVVWCAHVEGWTTLHTNCDSNQRPPNTRNCFRVCDWHRDVYGWKLGAWNECMPISTRTLVSLQPPKCSGGEEGIQTREVTCILKSDDSPAEDAICEYFEPRPHVEQACWIPCPQDCIASEYSPWTSCSKTCGTGLRNRIRRILVPPRFGGVACPNLTEFRSCRPEPCNGPEGLYSLRVEPWSPCVLPNTRPVRQVKPRNSKSQSLKGKVGVTDPRTREPTGTEQTGNRLNLEESSVWDIQVGYQTRNITCLHRNGSSVEHK